MLQEALLTVVMMLSGLPAAAQEPLVGTWRVIYPAGVQVDNGVQNTVMGTGTLRIVAQGDSLVGDFVPDPVAEFETRGPSRMAGLKGTGMVPLVTSSMLVLEVNGEQRGITLVSTWELEAKGDSLTGTLSHRVEGANLAAQEPGPVRGTRTRE